jgi:hypothetical protein
MKRRKFITLLGGAAVAWPLEARGQQAGRIYRLGILHNQGPQSPQFPPFYDELRRQGFVEGQNLIVDGRGYAVRTEQFPAVAADLAKARVDAILAGGTAAARAAWFCASKASRLYSSAVMAVPCPDRQRAVVGSRSELLVRFCAILPLRSAIQQTG